MLAELEEAGLVLLDLDEGEEVAEAIDDFCEQLADLHLEELGEG